MEEASRDDWQRTEGCCGVEGLGVGQVLATDYRVAQGGRGEEEEEAGAREDHFLSLGEEIGKVMCSTGCDTVKCQPDGQYVFFFCVGADC